MKQVFRFLTAVVVGGFLLAVMVLGGYLAFTRAAANDPAGAPVGQTLSCQAVLALLSEQAETIDCSNLPDSSACYGRHRVRVEPQTGASVMFDEPGDQEFLSKLRAISTDPLDLTTGDWGIALLRTRLAENGRLINAPPAVFMLYGAASIENASDGSNAPANQTYSGWPARVLH